MPKPKPGAGRPLKVLDLFSGIGGFSLGLEAAGMETIAFCEIDPFCRKVLNKHWPDVPIYTDVRELTNERLESDGLFPDIITGGFPCQDISYAGKGAGIEGKRSGLWTELARIIGEVRPRYAVLENVSALLSRGLERVTGDLAEIGYDCEWHCIPASYVGAPHRRDRIWIIAYPNSDGSHKPNEGFDEDESQRELGRGYEHGKLVGNGEILAYAKIMQRDGCDGKPRRKVSESGNSDSENGGHQIWTTLTRFCRMVDGLS